MSAGHHYDTTIVFIADVIEYFISGFDIVLYIIIFSYVKNTF
jgi:hypothetical protein